MEEEIYKDIVWYEWLYQISNLWNVKSLERQTFNGKHKYKRILKHCTKSWEFIKTWNCMKDASIDLHISSWWLSDCCKWKNKTIWWYRFSYVQ
jgi:hypothetical protein